MDIYTLSRTWFNWAFENPEMIKPNHTALYFFCIEHCNRLGGKEKFGLPTTMAKEAIGISSYNTYIKTLNDLIDWGFIVMIQKSRNQHSSNIIALSNFDKALDKALDKAMIKHGIKQSESTKQSNSSIDIQINKETIIQEYNKDTIIDIPDEKHSFYFKNELLNLGIEKTVVLEWLKIRKAKKLTNSEIAFRKLKKEIIKSCLTPNECITIAVEKSWGGFESEWILNNNNSNNYGNRFNSTSAKDTSRTDAAKAQFLNEVATGLRLTHIDETHF
jgi:hypothetical protein